MKRVIFLSSILLSFAAFAADTVPDATNEIRPLSATHQVLEPSRAVMSTALTVQPKAVLQAPVEVVIPELILGGEWTSVIKLTNRSSQTLPFTNVYFVDNLGNPMKTTFQTTNGNVITDVGFGFSLSPGGEVEGTFFGGSASVFGHALVALCNSSGVCSKGLYAEVALRNHNATRPDFESVFPIEQPAATQYMLWDHRAGLTTTLYLVNENTTATTVFLDYMNTNNQLIRTLSVTLPSLGSQILVPHVLAPETIGLQGTLVIRGQNPSGALITATALRINPSNSFTPVRAFIPNL